MHESVQLPNLVFCDKKSFRNEHFVNEQNNRVYLPKRSDENVHLRLATRTQEPEMVMVWDAVTAVFTDRGVKINAEYYRQNVLKAVLKPCVDKRFSRMDIPTGLSKTKNGFKRRFLASFLPHNGQQNLRT